MASWFLSSECWKPVQSKDQAWPLVKYKGQPRRVEVNPSQVSAASQPLRCDEESAACARCNGVADAVVGRAAEQRDAEDALDRRQDLREHVVERDQAIGIDVDAVAGEELVVGARLAALEDRQPIDRQNLAAR